MNFSRISHSLGLKAYEQSWILAEKQSTFLTRRFFLTLSMASWCKRCGQQVLRNLPFTVVRITEGEMRSYYDFLKKCVKLECMAKKGMYHFFEREIALACTNKLHITPDVLTCNPST
uniref:Uncharacterized protein n=1 Tax=Chelonoidis abingdonii TaxID=106734 RepID=A0A8C0IT78_CHEAB